MAQKDSKVNISLAETSATIAQESKKDSSSMKAIAVLTMCFLPGTFLAAIFAMPLFNWDASEGEAVVKSGFRWYWAIAVPLTVLVLGVWVLAMLLPWRIWIKSLRREEKGGDVETAMGKEGKTS
jgi:Mg2+ and Co2+ transporter CorA